MTARADTYSTQRATLAAKIAAAEAALADAQTALTDASYKELTAGADHKDTLAVGARVGDAQKTVDALRAASAGIDRAEADAIAKAAAETKKKAAAALAAAQKSYATAVAKLATDTVTFKASLAAAQDAEKALESAAHATGQQVAGHSVARLVQAALHPEFNPDKLTGLDLGAGWSKVDRIAELEAARPLRPLPQAGFLSGRTDAGDRMIGKAGILEPVA